MTTTTPPPSGRRPERARPAAPARPTGERRPRRRPASATVGGRIEGLDGIRAVAVVAVIVYHLWPDRLPGGFLGVDVFFVISGFLITTLLLRERTRTGRVDLRGFWLRRARRLLPALVVVVVVSVVAAALVERDLLVGIGRQVLGAATFSTNWLEVAHGADYFDATAPTLFLTFWSLAVEEQFYVIWPLAVLGLLAITGSATQRVRLVLGIGAVSAVLMAVLFTPGTNPTRVYYGTDTHLVGLMIGAAVALAFHGDVGVVAQSRWIVLRRWVGFVALGGIAVLFLTVHSSGTFTYRGGIVLTSLLTAVAVACLPGGPSAFTAWNRNPVLTWIGERSYGLYLWHWPVILVVTELLPASSPGAGPSLAVVALAVALTLGLTEASYRWVEMPVRHGGFRSLLGTPSADGAGAGARGTRPRTAALVGAGLAAVLFAGLVATAPTTSAAQRAVEEGQRKVEAQAAAFEGSGGATTTTAPAEAAWPADQALPSGDRIVGFGDSVLSAAAPALYERFPGILLDAKPIRQWREAPGLVAQAEEAGALRSVVVLNFGTNAGLESEGSREALDTVLDQLGPDRRVVLVNTVGVSDWVPDTNERLAAVSAQHDNTIVMDWHSRVAQDPSLLHPDRTHPNLEGIDVYADLLATTIQELGPR